MSRSEAIPPTARAIALLLSSTPTVHDAQPGVLHQLLEFSHRYTAQILSDALVYAEHAGRPGKVEMDDITLAVQARVGWEFGGRVPKEVCPIHDPTMSKRMSTNLLIVYESTSFPSPLKRTRHPCLGFQKCSGFDYPRHLNA